LTKGFAESAGDADTRARNDAIIVRSLERVGSDGTDQPAEVRQALTRYIEGLRGSPQFLKLIARYRADGFRDEVMKMALADDDSAGVEALRMLLADNANGKSLAGLLASADAPGAPRLATRLGQLGNPPAIKLLTDTVAQEAVPYPVRSAAVRGLASSKLGAKALLQAAQRGALAPDTRLLAGGLLNRSDQPDIRETASKLFPQPLQGDSQPLPALDQLVAMSGDATRGAELFRTKATCANCHLVGGQGKQVGPDLSEIGDKLSPEAMFTSILDPSAGISHNYETYLALLDSGQLVTGLLVNQTDDAVTIRTPEAIDRTIPRGEIVELKKGEKSIMPEGLHQTVEAQGLVDIIQYMRTLKRKG
jgi:putative heme-binding domain-containing protein